MTESRNSAPSSVGLARKRFEPPQLRFADRDSGPWGLFDNRLPASCPGGAPGRGGSALLRALLIAARWTGLLSRRVLGPREWRTNQDDGSCRADEQDACLHDS